MYDDSIVRCLLWFFLSLPAITALVMGLMVVAKSRTHAVNRWSIIMALLGIVLAVIGLAYVFLATVIDPANPHEASYWL
jgi:hypothetical protein